MPSYVYKCNGCLCEFIVTKKMSESSRPEVCAECLSGDTNKIPAMPQVLFKGDSWGDKNSRIKKQMSEKNKRLDTISNERKHDAPMSTLVPNVDGERVDSWAEAQKLAESKGKVSETYAQMVQKEQNEKKA